MVNLDFKQFYFKKYINLLSKTAIECIIESKRANLHELVQITGNFTHPSVVRLSQEIDEYIVQVQKMEIKNK